MGQFLGQKFVLSKHRLAATGDVVAEPKKILRSYPAIIVADLKAPDLMPWPFCQKRRTQLFSTSARARIRFGRRANLFHVVPDWAMREPMRLPNI
jgi:hypothetical protein